MSVFGTEPVCRRHDVDRLLDATRTGGRLSPLSRLLAGVRVQILTEATFEVVDDHLRQIRLDVAEFP